MSSKKNGTEKDMTAYEQALVAATKAATDDRDPGPLEALLQAALDEALGSDMPAKCAAAVKARKLLRKLRKQKAQEEEEAEAARAAAAKKKADQEEAERVLVETTAGENNSVSSSSFAKAPVVSMGAGGVGSSDTAVGGGDFTDPISPSRALTKKQKRLKASALKARQKAARQKADHDARARAQSDADAAKLADYRRREAQQAPACSNFRLDLGAALHNTCKCGRLKSEHQKKVQKESAKKRAKKVAKKELVTTEETELAMPPLPEQTKTLNNHLTATHSTTAHPTTAYPTTAYPTTSLLHPTQPREKIRTKRRLKSRRRRKQPLSASAAVPLATRYEGAGPHTKLPLHDKRGNDLIAEAIAGQLKEKGRCCDSDSCVIS